MALLLLLVVAVVGVVVVVQCQSTTRSSLECTTLHKGRLGSRGNSSPSHAWIQGKACIQERGVIVRVWVEMVG